MSTTVLCDLLSETGSSLYKLIGDHLLDLGFQAEDLQDMSMNELFEDSDFQKFGLNSEFLRSFVCQRAQEIILLFTNQNNCRTYHLHSEHMQQSFTDTNSKTYIEIGNHLHHYLVTPMDIANIQDLNQFFNKSDLQKLGLKSAAKHKLAFRKALNLIKQCKLALNTNAPLISNTNQPPTVNEPGSTMGKNSSETVGEQSSSTTTKVEKEHSPSPPPNPHQTIKNIVQRGPISMDIFWNHFFTLAHNVSNAEMEKAITSLMATVTEVKTTKEMIKCILHYMIFYENICKKSNKNNEENEEIKNISYKAFLAYCSKIKPKNIIETFQQTQNQFQQLLMNNMNNTFETVTLENMQETLHQISIFKSVLPSNCTSNVWKYMSNTYYRTSLHTLITIAFKFDPTSMLRKHSKNSNNIRTYKRRNSNSIVSDECKSNDQSSVGIEIIKSEILSNNSYMSVLLNDQKSSFFMLNEQQLIWIMSLDCTSIQEEILFQACRIWCERDVKQSKKMAKSLNLIKYKIWQQRIRVFIKYLRFPNMNTKFLLNEILPLKSKIFQHEEFFWILVYKLTVGMKSYEFDYRKLVCGYKPRLNVDTDNGGLEARIASLMLEKDALQETNEKLLKTIARLTNGKSGGSSPNTLPIKRRSSKAKRNKHNPKKRSSTNFFGTRILGSYRQKSFKFSSSKDDTGTPISEMKEQFPSELPPLGKPHEREVSIDPTTVKDLKYSATQVHFIVPVGENTTEKSDALNAMRKRMQIRAAKVKTAHQRKIEAEEQKKMDRQQEMQELRESQKQRKEQETFKREKRKKRKKGYIKVPSGTHIQHRQPSSLGVAAMISDAYSVYVNTSEEYSSVGGNDGRNDGGNDGELYENEVLKSGLTDYMENIDSEEDENKAVEKSGEIQGTPEIKNKENSAHAMNDMMVGLLSISDDDEDDDGIAAVDDEYIGRKSQQRLDTVVFHDLLPNNDNIAQSEIVVIANINVKKRVSANKLFLPSPNSSLAPPASFSPVDSDNDSEVSPSPRKSRPKKRYRPGQLKKVTRVERFESPLYPYEMTFAEKLRSKDEYLQLMQWRLCVGCKVQLKQQQLQGVVKYVGDAHFIYGYVIGMEIVGNSGGKHSGVVDKIKYFDCKKNGGVMFKIESIAKILKSKKKRNKKSIEKKGGKKRRNSKNNKTGKRESIVDEDEFGGDSIKMFSLPPLVDDEDDIDEQLDIDISDISSKKERTRIQKLNLRLGDVVLLDRSRRGILHFVGEIHSSSNPVMFGVELLDRAIGKNNGTIDDVQYFECEEKRGVFLESKNIRKKGMFENMDHW